MDPPLAGGRERDAKRLGQHKPKSTSFSGSAAGTLVLMLEEFKARTKSCVDGQSCSGPIASRLDPAARLRRALRRRVVVGGDWKLSLEKSREFWRKAKAPIAIASSGLAPIALRNGRVLATCNRFESLPCNIVNLTEAKDRLRRTDGTSLGPVMALGELSAEYLRPLSHCARPLDAGETASAARLWAKLTEENAMVRVDGGQGLVSAPATCFDDDLLSKCSRDWKRAVWAIGRTMGGVRTTATTPDFYLTWRLMKLVDGGLLESPRMSADGHRCVLSVRLESGNLQDSGSAADAGDAPCERTVSALPAARGGRDEVRPLPVVRGRGRFRKIAAAEFAGRAVDGDRSDPTASFAPQRQEIVHDGALFHT